MKYLTFMAVVVLAGCVAKDEPTVLQPSEAELHFDAVWNGASEWKGVLGDSETFRITHKQEAYKYDPVGWGFSFCRIPELAGEYSWWIPEGQQLISQDAPDGLMVFKFEELAALNNDVYDGCAEIRVVFRIHPEIIPIEYTQHGNEAEVGRLGTGLVPIAIEFIDASGKRLLQIFLENTNGHD